ncbi:unnamed protein product [Lactuca saligna]|uniref:RRM domain-containing protein n=1 Tax=Lactuca saligna TaxID=75948 RepID=A0AA36EGZ0_LACSI|nr:unnamed protein product [Lactuca saligna]
MPPRKTPIRRKKSSLATTPTPVGDHKSTTPEVETGAELEDVAKVKTDMSGQVEVSDPNSAKIHGDSTTSLAVSSESLIKVGIVLENSAVGDVNKARNEGGEPDVGGDKATEDFPLVSEDVGKGKQGEGDGIVYVENDESDETTVKKKDDLQRGSENVDQDKQGSGINGSQLETVTGDNEEEKQELAKTISAQESNADKAPCNNAAALVVEDGESDDDSEGDDADNEGDEDPSQDPVPDNKKDKDIEIYVGRLDKNTVEEDLVNVFQQFGELKSTRIVRNSTTKKSKGFAFIRFASPDQAKRALLELKDGVEVRGKHVKISESQDNHTLYLRNISKTWKKEEVLQQLKQYGIEHIEMIRLPENPKLEGKNKGFAFLEFTTHSDAVAAFQRLKKPDAVFGRDISAKVAFAQTPMHQNDEDLSQPQAKKVYLEGVTKDWSEEKVKEICKKYGEILRVDICLNPRTKHKDFGFITFASNENALACVEGINNAGIGGEVKIKANISKPQSKSQSQKQGFGGGFKVEASASNKEGGKSKEISGPKPIKAKGGLNSQQVKRNKNDSIKNKVKGSIKNGESCNKKRKASSDHNVIAPPNLRHGDTKKPKFGEGQNSKSASKPGNDKRKAPKHDGGNRNPQNKKPFKKQKGNVHAIGRERDNISNDNRIRRGHGHGHDDYRSTTRYMDHSYAVAAASNSFRLPPDSLSTRRLKEMEAHAGYIEPVSGAIHSSRPYSGYVQPNHNHPHHLRTVYLGSQSQNQVHLRYSDRPIMSQSQSYCTHRGYNIETTAVVPEVQPYTHRPYQQQSSILQREHDPYDSFLPIPRSVGHDGRGTVVTYVGGPPLSASQVRNHTSYYQC